MNRKCVSAPCALSVVLLGTGRIRFQHMRTVIGMMIIPSPDVQTVIVRVHCWDNADDDCNTIVFKWNSTYSGCEGVTICVFFNWVSVILVTVP